MKELELTKVKLIKIMKTKREKSVEFKVISPAIASEILKEDELLKKDEALKGNKPHNRPFSRRHKSYLSVEMKEGRWLEPSSDCIVFDTNGILINGQHRLRALISYGNAIEFTIMYGINRANFKGMDTGKYRSAADTLYVEKIKNNNALAAILKRHLKTPNEEKSTQSLPNAAISNSRILEEYMTDPKYWDNLTTFSNNIYKDTLQFGRGIVQGVKEIGFWVSIFDKINFTDSREFWNDFINGANNNPAKALHKALSSNALSKDEKMTPRKRNGTIVTAWNAYRDGKKLKKVTYNAVDKFPRVR